MRVEPLTSRHDRGSFFSGVEALDRYLRSQAGQDVRKRVASCFVLVDDDGAVPLGFYTVAAASIALAELPESLANRLPRYQRLPAVLMGRLAVGASHRRRGYGELLLLDALARALRSDIASYAFIVDAKDEEAVAFYRAYGFLPLTAEGRRLFLPMAEVAKLFA